jgi:AcrR family transcriptional regulator
VSDKRQQILDTATTLFSKHGYHAVGVDWIIADSGVAKMTMYRHFPSKTDLVIAVLRQRQQQCAVSLKALVAEADSPLGRLERLFDWHRDWFASPAFTGCMFTHAASEFADKGSSIHEISVEQKADLTQFIEQLLGDIVLPAQAAVLAPVIVMLLDGATLAVQISGRQSAATEAWNAVRDLLGLYCEPSENVLHAGHCLPRGASVS